MGEIESYLHTMLTHPSSVIDDSDGEDEPGKRRPRIILTPPPEVPASRIKEVQEAVRSVYVPYG